VKLSYITTPHGRANFTILNNIYGAVTLTIVSVKFRGQNLWTLEFYMTAKKFPTQVKLLTQIHHVEQQKATWLQSDFCVSCASCIINRHFCPSDLNEISVT